MSESSLQNLSCSLQQHFRIAHSTILTWYSRTIKYITQQAVFWWEEISIVESNFLCKATLTILWPWTRIRIGWWLFNKEWNLQLGYGLIINVSVVFNLLTKRFNRLDWATRSIWQWWGLIPAKGKLFSYLTLAK